MKKRKVWIKLWLLRRNQLVIYNSLFTEFRLEEKEFITTSC